ncbi:patatin-like phospholipase family protein [Glaciimonas soli]|uniref:Patatin-like phospholipase family protein n=1 Tax=Glaciimonas soli TaxID=2590999 RepID=A0A843YPZ9_9BURK|nr:patatin-like phospholipase family protein [Glaciimonas soli]MQQ99371.1 patatin-like phospholipase family protein [Glaciimonas soli]
MQKKAITLALQGGGSHGAFTWGVLDRLLEDSRVDIEGISGASAGAMNAVMLAYGYAVNGREGAKQALADFWHSVSTKEFFLLMPHQALRETGYGSHGSSTAMWKGLASMMRLFSPYQFNPFDINPLRDILVKQIDFERLRSDGKIPLFIAATQVSTGTLKIFRNNELSVDALLASACLPAMHRAVEIKGEAYWDGGLTANPPIFPLLHFCASSDIMVVLLHPFRRPKVPTTTEAIGQRLSEISFSSAFFTELGGLALAKRRATDDPHGAGELVERLKKLNMHVIDANDLMSNLSISSKLNTKASFINALHGAGREQADLWLRENFDDLGKRSSFNLDQFLP